MKRRTFIQTASATAFAWLAQSAGAQQAKKNPKVQPKITVRPPMTGQSPTQQIITRLQQLADGGS